MDIKSILTPLLLLSLATGLYSPIEAAEAKHRNGTSNNKAVAMYICAIHTKATTDVQHNTVELIQLGETTQSAQARYDILKKLTEVFSQFSNNNNNNTDDQGHDALFIFMMLPEEYITASYLQLLDYWFHLVQNVRLAQYTTLCITGEHAKRATGTFSKLIAATEITFNKGKENKNKPLLNTKKIIWAASPQEALATTLQTGEEFTNITLVNTLLRQNLNLEKMEIVAHTSHLVFSFSGEGLQCSFFSAEQDSQPAFIQAKPIDDINQLKVAVAQHMQSKQISSIVLKCSGDDLLSDNADEQPKFLPHFITVFGNLSLKGDLIRLMITGDNDHEKVKKTLLTQITSPVEGNVFFVKEEEEEQKYDDENAITFNEQKIIWCTEESNMEEMLRKLDKAQAIPNEQIANILAIIATKLSKQGHVVFDFSKQAKTHNPEFFIHQLDNKNIQQVTEALDKVGKDKKISTAIALTVTVTDLIEKKYDELLAYWLTIFSHEALKSFNTKLVIIGTYDSDEKNITDKLEDIITTQNDTFQIAPGDIASSKNIDHYLSWEAFFSQNS